MGRRTLSIASVAFAALAIVISASCSSSYSADATGDASLDAIPAGSEGGACYPNDTCNAGLTCASHLCVRIDGGGAISDAASTSTDASSSELDGGDNMAGTIDAGDAGDAGMCVPSSAVKLLQYTCTNQNDLLCIDQAKPLGVCNATCIAGQIPAGCSGNSCGGGLLFCCANNFMLKSGATCPLVMQGLASTQCAGACAPGTQLCEKDDQCPMGETCRLARVELSMTSSSGSLYVGLCE